MTLEREYKFTLSDDRFPSRDELRAVLTPARLELGRYRLKKQHDRYFDTRTHTLMRAGWALRKRTWQGAQIITLKTAGQRDGALHEREELEVEQDDDRLWPKEIADRLAEMVSLSWLEPILDIHTERHCYPVSRGDTPLAELSLDDVSAHYPDHEMQATFKELELEAAPSSTPRDELDTIVEALDGLMALVPSHVNKLERARALLDLAEGFRDA